MTDPNEEINEELSTNELKGVSGGSSFPGKEGNWGEGQGLKPNDPKGSGSGKTLKDWEKSKKTGLVRGHLDY